MKEVYGVSDEAMQKLNRQSSRGSVRSAKSVKTPIASRKERQGRHQPGQAQA